MSEQAIKKLRRKFILGSMLALCLAMLLIGGMIYLVSSAITRHTISLSLDYIIECRGEISQRDDDDYLDKKSHGTITIDEDGNIVISFLNDLFMTREGYSAPEFTYSVRYFAVLYDKNESIYEVKTNHIASVTTEDALSYAGKIKKKHDNFGRDGYYYYKYKEYDDGSGILVYLDCYDEVQTGHRMLRTSFILFAFGIIISYVVSSLLSKKAISPEVKNAELQKQFITNASHELKTPLAVIKANTEMTEMLEGETEWTQSTMRQIDRMNGLIKNLVMIAKAEEGSEEEKCDVNISKVVVDCTETFSSMAAQDDKKLEMNIEDNVIMTASESQIRQLVTLLLDNAIKYCDEKGTVTVDLSRKSRGVGLVVSNSYAEGEGVDYSRFFERFYRKDESHNIEKGGYGIGLSIAESLVKQYKGEIDATWKAGVISFNCYLRALKK